MKLRNKHDINLNIRSRINTTVCVEYIHYSVVVPAKYIFFSRHHTVHTVQTVQKQT